MVENVLNRPGEVGLKRIAIGVRVIIQKATLISYIYIYIYTHL